MRVLRAGHGKGFMTERGKKMLDDDEPLTVPRYYGHDVGVSRLAWRVDRLEQLVQELLEVINHKKIVDSNTET